MGIRTSGTSDLVQLAHHCDPRAVRQWLRPRHVGADFVPDQDVVVAGQEHANGAIARNKIACDPIELSFHQDAGQVSLGRCTCWVSSDKVSIDAVVIRACNVNAVAEEIVDSERPDGAVAGHDCYPIRVAAPASIQLDQGRARIAMLAAAINDDRLGYGRQCGMKLDDMDSIARDVELDLIRSGMAVGGQNRFSQGARAAVRRTSYSESRWERAFFKQLQVKPAA